MDIQQCELTKATIDLIFTLLKGENIDNIATFGQTSNYLYDVLHRNYNIQPSDTFNYVQISDFCPPDAPIRKNYLTTPFVDSNNKLRKVSHIIASNILPFGIKLPDKFKPNKDKYKRFVFTPKTLEQANLMHIIASLNENGKAIILSNIGLLSRKVDKEIRKYLIENNLLEEIIFLSENVFENTNTSFSILILNKNKNDSNISFVDASFNNGEPIKDNKVIKKSLCTVSGEAIASNDYSFNLPLYISMNEENTNIDLKDLKNEILDLEKELSTVKDNLAQGLEKLGGDKTNR